MRLTPWPSTSVSLMSHVSGMCDFTCAPFRHMKVYPDILSSFLKPLTHRINNPQSAAFPAAFPALVLPNVSFKLLVEVINVSWFPWIPAGWLPVVHRVMAADVAWSACHPATAQGLQSGDLAVLADHTWSHLVTLGHTYGHTWCDLPASHHFCTSVFKWSTHLPFGATVSFWGD